jgi:hypothetical protein
MSQVRILSPRPQTVLHALGRQQITADAAKNHSHDGIMAHANVAHPDSDGNCRNSPNPLSQPVIFLAFFICESRCQESKAL